jgi:hypothetical protein
MSSETTPKLLEEIYRLQTEVSDLDPEARHILTMCANLLKSHYEVKEARNRLTFEEFDDMPGRWDLVDGMLMSY